MRFAHFSVLTLATSFFLASCGGLPEFTPVHTGENLRVSGLAATDDCPLCLDDVTGLVLSHQTPSQLEIGVTRVELLRSAFDDQPHVLIDHEEPEITDLLETATFVDVDTGSIPPGVYPFMRVTLASTRFTVDASAHLPGSGVHPGTLAVDYALSDYKDAELGERLQGDYVAQFAAPDVDLPFDSNAPVSWPVPYPGASVDTSDGLYRVTFPSPQAINISHSAPTSVDVDVTFYTENAFGWFDRPGDENKEGILDLSIDPLSGEVPASLGISGFSMAVH